MTAASYQTTDNTADGIAHVTCPGRTLHHFTRGKNQPKEFIVCRLY